jgi:hypothetical protein
MPKGTKWIFPKPIAVVFGKPILADEYQNCSDKEILTQVSTSFADLYRHGKNLIDLPVG